MWRRRPSRSWIVVIVSGLMIPLMSPMMSPTEGLASCFLFMCIVAEFAMTEDMGRIKPTYKPALLIALMVGSLAVVMFIYVDPITSVMGMMIGCASCDQSGTERDQHKGDDVIQCDSCDSILFRDIG